MQEEKHTDTKKNVNSLQTGLKQTPKQPIKKKKKISGAAIFSIFLVVVIIGLFAAIYLDLGGAKQMAVSLLKLEPAPAATDAAGGMTQAELEQRSGELDKRDTGLDARQDALDTKEDELSTKEQDLKQRETAVTEAEGRVSEQRKIFLVSAAKIYESMDVKKAAKAIGGMDTAQEMAEILLYMDNIKAAAILDQLSSALATEILSEMMR